MDADVLGVRAKFLPAREAAGPAGNGGFVSTLAPGAILSTSGATATTTRPDRCRMQWQPELADVSRAVMVNKSCRFAATVRPR
jgi:hypothetical protein